MELIWNEKEGKYGLHWLELKKDGKAITRVLLVDCVHNDLCSGDVIKYKYSGNTITEDITLDEAKVRVEQYLKNWWDKRYKSAERDYLEAMEIVEFLK